MAAPTNTDRITPTGERLTDGHSTKFVFSGKPAINLWEKSTQIPGVDGGQPVPNDTMFNQIWRRKTPRKLKDIPGVTVIASYDPKFWSDIVSQVNIEQALTFRFPNYDTLDIFGFLRAYSFSPHKEGESPEVTLNIEFTNWDPTNKVEAGPVYTEYTGTGS